MGRYKVRFHVEIVPIGESGGPDPEGGILDGVDEEAVRTVSAEQAVSIDDMEETLLENAYEVMRRAVGKHLSAVSKKGLSTGSERLLGSSRTLYRTGSTAVWAGTTSPPIGRKTGATASTLRPICSTRSREGKSTAPVGSASTACSTGAPTCHTARRPGNSIKCGNRLAPRGCAR